MLRFLAYGTLVLVAACLVLGASIALASDKQVPLAATAEETGRAD